MDEVTLADLHSAGRENNTRVRSKERKDVRSPIRELAALESTEMRQAHC